MRSVVANAMQPDPRRGSGAAAGDQSVLFGTESPGSGGAIRKETGKPSDDMIPVIDGLGFLSAEDKLKIFQTNPLKVFTKVKI